MSERKELTKVQRYAIAAAADKIRLAKVELQTLAEDIALEHGLDIDNETWSLSADMRYLEMVEK